MRASVQRVTTPGAPAENHAGSVFPDLYFRMADWAEFVGREPAAATVVSIGRGRGNQKTG